MNLIRDMLQTPLDTLQAFKAPADYLALASNSFTPEARALASDLKTAAQAAATFLNRATAMLRDLEGQFDETPRIVLNSDHVIMFDPNFDSADLALEVALFEREVRHAAQAIVAGDD